MLKAIKNCFNNINYEYKQFYIFLLVNLIVWSTIGLIRLVLPTDSLEGIFWGSLHDFGTPKHPPLAGWLTYITYSIFKSDYSIYLLSTSFIACGIFFIHKIASFFLDEKRAILCAFILEACWAYTYVTCYYGFNPDVVLLCFLPLITYFGYRCLNRNKISDWILLGIFVGLSFLNKYQTAFTVVSLVLWAICFKREIFKLKRVYFSILIAFLIFLPHLLWLIKYDFFPILYFEGELSSDTFLNHIIAPLTFMVVQISAILGVVVIYTFLKLKQKSKFIFLKTINKDAWFLIFMGLFPLFAHIIMGFMMGGTMRPRWGFEFLYMVPVLLFYFLPSGEISRKDFDFVVKFSYFAMFVTFIVMGSLLSVEKNYRSRYPYEQLYTDFNNVWENKFHTSLKYLGGYIEWTLPLTIYGKTHPTCILDTNGYKNPWLDENELKKNGCMIINRTKDQVIGDIRKYCPYIDDNSKYEPIEYKFDVENAFGIKREYIIYYLIIPPIKE